MTVDNKRDVLIVGAGFSGLYQTHLLHNLHGYSTQTFETCDEPGGTWNSNRYPGARVDIVSRDYCFKFDKNLYKEWDWSEIYAPQQELLSYVKHIVDRYNLDKLIQFKSCVKTCKWSDANLEWTVEVDHTLDGIVQKETWVGRHLVSATGCLSAPKTLREFHGLEEFVAAGGKTYHTATWPKQDVTFTGRRVAVVGTGSSAVQVIPIIAEQATQLTVFQRTAAYTVPAWNRKLREGEMDEDKENVEAMRAKGRQSMFGNAIYQPYTKTMKEHTPEQAEARFEETWAEGGIFFYASFPELLISRETSDAAKAFFHKKIKQIVKDPKTAELLCPQHPPGCKRICVDTNYWETFNKPTVKLVSVKNNPLKVVGGKDKYITLENGERYGPFDDIVTAVGFDAMTGALDRMNIIGQGGLTLKEYWHAGPLNYLGLLIADFPNLYHIAGPGSPSVLTNMVYAIEHHVEWIADAITKMDKEGIKAIVATRESEKEWVRHVGEVASQSLLYNCNSWFLGANVPGKPRIFMPLLGFGPYVEKCKQVLANNFEGCQLIK